MFKILSAIIILVSLASCDSTNTRVSNVAFGSSKGIVTSGNLRLVTERTRIGYPATVCTEPSPDYMVAFDRNRKLVATRPTAAGEQKLDIDASTLEEIVKGEGRSSAVLALRDGLYTACQSYANGVIGQDAYAIILSQYGNLLVALVGNDHAAKTIQVSGPQAAISAMTVACISGHDPSRHISEQNTLLTKPFCQKLLAGVVARAPSGERRNKGGVAGVDRGETKPKPAPPVAASGSNVTTTTTTNTVVK